MLGCFWNAWDVHFISVGKVCKIKPLIKIKLLLHNQANVGYFALSECIIRAVLL